MIIPQSAKLICKAAAMTFPPEGASRRHWCALHSCHRNLDWFDDGGGPGRIPTIKLTKSTGGCRCRRLGCVALSSPIPNGSQLASCWA